MLKPSKIVILDEATSSVDPENEEQLMLALNNLLKGKTVLVIAHKLETIQGADQIIVMDRGKIENVGTHKELLKKSDIYKKFISQREKAYRRFLLSVYKSFCQSAGSKGKKHRIGRGWKRFLFPNGAKACNHGCPV